MLGLDPQTVIEGVARGAYVVSEADGGAPDVILIGTGSELEIAMSAQALLAERGVKTRVVSMPSWTAFEAESQDYRDSILPPHITARVSIEAGVTTGWEKWVGENGVILGVDRFGASAPYKQIYQKFGLTADYVAERAQGLLEKA